MNSVLKCILIGFLIIIFMSLMISFSYAKTKTFYGKVTDADTGEPIEGAVVVAYWHDEKWIPFGEWITKLKDVKEALTDKNGEWSIRGPAGEDCLYNALALMGIAYCTRAPEFIIFKPGYCSWPQGFSIDACRNRIKITGDKDEGIGEGGTLELPKPTNRERMTMIRNIPSLGMASEFEENLPLFKKLVEQEEKEIPRR